MPLEIPKYKTSTSPKSKRNGKSITLTVEEARELQAARDLAKDDTGGYHGLKAMFSRFGIHS
jgi:hypothetical protein